MKFVQFTEEVITIFVRLYNAHCAQRGI